MSASQLDTLLQLTRRLSDLVAREIAMIEARTPDRIAEHAPERDRLSALYAREMNAARAEPTLLKMAPPAALEALKQETARFNDALDRHRRLLTRMRRVTEGIVKAVAGEASKAVAPRAAYGPGAKAAAPRYAAPVAVNAKI
jgi:hypothetical protein